MGDAVAVFPSALPTHRSNDTEHEYRQDSDFFFLSGFEEPHSVFVLAPAHPVTKSILFLRRRDSERERWDGPRTGVEGAGPRYEVDAAYGIEELDERLPELLATSDKLYYAFADNEAFNHRIVRELKRYHDERARTDRGPIAVADPSSIIHELRVKKSPEDVAALRRAVRISGEGHMAAMRYSRPGMYEYEIEAIVEYTFARLGAQAVAYPSIVAGGPNATILHYNKNREAVPDGSLVLIDAGAEADYFCGDITRTWPISGKFSAEQQAVYEVVLEAQRRAIAMCRPGTRVSRTVELKGTNGKVNGTFHAAAVKAVVEGLLDLGLLSGSFEENIERQLYHRFFMHGTGHWLGMDTHDVGSYRADGDWRPLEPGMVVTVEPGIYIPQDSSVDERFRGIGIRIEDDVLITENGCDVLSADTPKTIAEIEALIAQGRAGATPLIA
ncbi:MAG: aminopeptidase P N-terminal domain-containing protein [Candidatus Eremiobacteraeota bacterium]|nr:aminopeptidase P N-terminal domain-containing protein [Candidatus Eremiobacteraeota bacterium]MBC5826855.1 aminopeptidase P N-terminal domain-containing protein [Candidatus Eremiobacteraeota bacterium]